MTTQQKYAVAFVHTPTGEVGRTDFIFATQKAATEVCKELDGIADTILHFALGEHEDIRVLAERRKDNENRGRK